MARKAFQPSSASLRIRLAANDIEVSPLFGDG